MAAFSIVPNLNAGALEALNSSRAWLRSFPFDLDVLVRHCSNFPDVNRYVCMGIAKPCVLIDIGKRDCSDT
jgi:hypothetical protein